MYNRIEAFWKGIEGRRVAFLGIGVSNTPLIEQFLSKGALVTACDKRERSALLDAADRLETLGVTLKTGSDYLKNLDVDVIFRTPGMRFYIDELNEARSRGIAVTSEMEVFFDLCPCPIFAVTGSDGKTTTTTIISEMLKSGGKTVHLGGNIGRALLPVIEEISADDAAVVELSSFQLISMRKSPNVAVVTNVTPNHLDMHKDMTEYIEAKKNIFLHQNAFSRTVLNLDNGVTRDFAPEVRGEPLFFSRQSDKMAGAFLENDIICFREHNNDVTRVINAGDIAIPGVHNVENYMAAISAVWGYVSIESMVKVAKTFMGVEHRAELVRELDGVKYYNDSIATTPTRMTSGTLSLYDRKITVIAGGYDKKIPFDTLGSVLCEKVGMLILMGVTAPKIEQAVLNAENYRDCGIKIIKASSMEEAVKAARDNAKHGDIVSLCPACASFDMYPNFEVRGSHYKDIVNSLT